MEEYKFQRMVDRKFDEFVEKFDDYFGMKMLDNMMTTLDVLLYLEHKPEENCTEIEKQARACMAEIRQFKEEFEIMRAINKQRAIDFKTELSRVSLTRNAALGGEASKTEGHLD